MISSSWFARRGLGNGDDGWRRRPDSPRLLPLSSSPTHSRTAPRKAVHTLLRRRFGLLLLIGVVPTDWRSHSSTGAPRSWARRAVSFASPTRAAPCAACAAGRGSWPSGGTGRELQRSVPSTPPCSSRPTGCTGRGCRRSGCAQARPPSRSSGASTTRSAGRRAGVARRRSACSSVRLEAAGSRRCPACCGQLTATGSICRSVAGSRSSRRFVLVRLSSTFRARRRGPPRGTATLRPTCSP